MTGQPTRRSVLAGGAGIAALAALAGCRRAVDLEQRPANAATVRRGGTLHMIQSTDILPALVVSQNNPNFSVCRTIWNTLIELDHRTLQPKPSLASSWTISADRTTYVFQLRDDVRYHSGRPFGPADVIFVLNYLTKDAVTTQVKATAKQISSAKATGAHEVTVTFSQPVNNVWDMFEMAIMIDRETVDGLATGSKLIGTGPFVLDSYKPNSSITLKRNPHYWKPGRPYLDGVEIAIIDQSTSAVAAMRSGQAQLALDLSPLDAAGLRDSTGFQVIEADTNDSTYYVAANVDIAPLDKLEVRQAIAWAIDRKRILDQALGDIGRVSSLPWSQRSPAWDDEQAAHYHYDPDRAEKMIRSAGARGKPVGLYYSDTLVANASVGLIVQANLRGVGLDCELHPTDPADYQKRFSTGKIPGLMVNAHGFGQLRPSTLAKGALPFNAMKNSSNFTSADYTRLSNAIWTASGSALEQAYSDFNDLLLEQQFVIDLVSSSHTYTISRSLQGLAYTMYDYLDLDDAYLA